MIYADYNATAPLRPEARAAIEIALDLGANPSSVHGAGRAARKTVERARSQVAAAINAEAENLVFTSGGTEAVALAIQGVIAAQSAPVTLLVSAIEHEAVSQTVARAGVAVETIYVTPDGQIDLDELLPRLSAWDSGAKGRPIVVVMRANNETGVIQPVEALSDAVHAAGGLLVCDGVQALGKISLDVGVLGADLIAFSAHKCGGPQGVGALWHRPGVPIKPVQVGGGQERSLRSGTENVSGIVGFGAAAEAATRDLEAYSALGPLRDAMEARLVAEGGVTVMGADSPRLAGTSCFACSGFRAETQVMAMDLGGVAVSSGAACSSGKVKRSLVLGAMGVSDALAECAIRTSFGWKTAPGDFDKVAETWLAAARRTVLKESA